jgi:hypothetical protein
MSLPEWHFAADGAAYTYADFEQWYGAHARQMWEEAAATEHRQSQRRRAADETAHTHADFEQWYGAHARRMWGGAAATEHIQNHTVHSSNVRPVQRSAADGIAYTYTGYGADAAELWERADATEHSESNGLQTFSSGSAASHPADGLLSNALIPRIPVNQSPLRCSDHRILHDLYYTGGQPRTAQTIVCSFPVGRSTDVVNVHAPSGSQTLTDSQRQTLLTNLLQSNSRARPGRTIGNANFLIGGDMNTSSFLFPQPDSPV